MVDYGDFNPTSNADHFVKMTAYDEEGGAVVDEQILSFVDAATVNPPALACPATYPGGAGDACTAEPGEPGNYTWKVENETGMGIGYITLEFGAGFDPKIGFDNLCVIR
jgi:hypothetical protein